MSRSRNLDESIRHLSEGEIAAVVRADHGAPHVIARCQREIGDREEAQARILRTEEEPADGLRWPVERTNSWLSNFGQMRRNTDRKTIHRLAQLALAVALLLTAKLIDWRNRRSPAPAPIR